jgi:hypothetical protein
MTRRLPSALAARNQLRVRVLAGVVAVTLAALAAFDFTAVTTMRHNLYQQTQNQLSAVIPDWGELQAMIGSGYTLPVPNGTRGGPDDPGPAADRGDALQADRITAGDLSDRVAPRNPRSVSHRPRRNSRTRPPPDPTARPPAHAG